MSEAFERFSKRPRHKNNNYIQQIRGFCNTVIFGGVEKASREMHLTQPAVTSQIKSLESDLGIKLIQKSNRNIELTESGKKFYKFVIPILRRVESIYDDFLHIIDMDQTKVLRIVSTINVIDMWLPEKIKKILSRWPNMSIEIDNVEDANAAIHRLRQNLSDIAIYPLDEIPHDLKLANTVSYKPMISISVLNELSRKKYPLSIDDLRDQRIILVRSDSMLPIYISLFKKYQFKNSGLTFNNVSSWNTARLYVQQNIGITFSTYRDLDKNKEDGIIDIDVSNMFPIIDYRIICIDNQRIRDIVDLIT